MKKALKVVLCVLGAVVALAALGILFLTITEYRPADVEQLEVISEEHDGGAADPVSPQLQAGEELTVLSWNIATRDSARMRTSLWTAARENLRRHSYR